MTDETLTPVADEVAAQAKNPELRVEVINAILNYLSTKPFAEVAQLIQAISADLQSQAHLFAK